MKAIVQNRYGDSSVLTTKDVETPAIKDDEVLIKVHAVSLNSGDAFSMRGTPYMIRFYVGFPRPKDYILGWDIAGIIEKVGADVTKFKLGDRVYTACEKGFAEYVNVKEEKVGLAPESLSSSEAASIPTAGLTALQGLRDSGKVKDGDIVLINGASGGVGHFAVQIARSFGCHVTGVCSTKNVDLVKSLGAENVVDYTKDDFTKGSERYDLIFDMAASKKFGEMKRVLSKEGFIVPNSGHGGMSYVLKGALLGAISKKVGKMYMAKSTTADLDLLAEMVAKGDLRPVIDRTYDFDEIPKGLDYVAKGHARGKVVATLDDH